MEEHALKKDHEQLRDFFVKDYELKVRYVTDHFTRMWTRFNFFLTLDSALFAFSMNASYVGFAWLFVSAGVLLTLVWLGFGHLDNRLADNYRGQVQQTFDLLKDRFVWDDADAKKTYYYAGQPIRRSRISLSITGLAVFLPIVFLLLWALRAIAALMSVG